MKSEQNSLLWEAELPMCFSDGLQYINVPLLSQQASNFKAMATIKYGNVSVLCYSR